MKEPLEDVVRRVDQDRWLSSRFAPAAQRKNLVALYAFNYELAHIGETNSDANLGAIRLQFWADAIAAIYEGRAPVAHPVIAPLTIAIKAGELPRALFDEMIEARHRDLEAAPFEHWNDLEAYLDATAGNLIRLAARICAPGAPIDAGLSNFIRSAGRAWGYIGLVRALPYWSLCARTFFPKRLREHLKLDEAVLYSGGALDHAAASAVRAVLDRGVGVLRDVHRYSPAAPKEIFPAIGYLSLTKSYIRAASGEPGMVRDLFKTSLLARQVTLVGAAATGSI